MTAEALMVVRAFGDAFAAADFARISETLAPDIVWFGTRGGLDEQRVLRGPDAVLEYLREIRDPWKRLDVEAERLIDAGETVVVFLREGAGPTRRARGAERHRNDHQSTSAEDRPSDRLPRPRRSPRRRKTDGLAKRRLRASEEVP